MVHSPVWTFPISFLETICQYLNMSDSDMLTLSECSGHWRRPLIDYNAMHLLHLLQAHRPPLLCQLPYKHPQHQHPRPHHPYLLVGRLSAPSSARQSSLLQPPHQRPVHQILPLKNWHTPPSLTEEPGPMFLSARRAKILALGFTVPATFAGPIYTS